MKRLTVALVAGALFILLAVIPAAADTGWSGTEGPTPPGGYVVVRTVIDPAYVPPAGTMDANGGFIRVCTPGETIKLVGENTASDTTYLFITGPGLPANGAQIHNPDPANSPLENGNPATFLQAAVKSDHTWSWTWDTTGYKLKDGTYRIYIVPRPTDFDNLGPTIAYGYDQIIIRNPGSATVSPSATIPAATTRSTTTPTTTTTTTSVNEEAVIPGVVTIMVRGSQVYNLGDEINLTGTNTAGWKTYLFLTGPNLDPKGSDPQTTIPRQNPVVDGNASSFKVMDVNGDRTWIWRWGTANMALDAGTYTMYAVAGPHDKDHLENTPYGSVSFIIRRPLESTTTAPAPVTTATAVPIATQMAPTQSPGYGFLAALAGLGAVATIMCRRH